MATSNMIVQHNIAAMNTHRNMKNVGIQQSKASEKLSSGYRINTAADDAAGLAISEKMRAQIRGLNQASSNVSDAISLIKTAEGGMQGIDDMLHRIRELVDYAANDTNENNKVGTGDRQKIQDEIDALVAEIDDMSERVEFNKKKLINGSFQDTSEQLANAKDLFDRTSIEKTAAVAKYTALTSALSTAKTDLNTAQTNLDDVAIPAYKAAVTTFTQAQIDYTTAEKEYKDAKTQLQQALDNAQIADVTSLTTYNFGPSNSDGTYVGPEKAAALISALDRYNQASKTLGLDEMNLQGLGTAEWGVASAGLIDQTKVDSDAVLRTSDSANAAAGTQIALFSAAKADFTTAELKYNTAVAARDTAQSKVDSIQTQLTEQLRALNNVNTRYTAADVSYSAAISLDQAGNSKALHFQVGSNGGQSLVMSIGSLKSDTLGIGDGHGASWINVVKDTGQDITATLDVLDQSLSYVTTERSKLGAAQNRMEYTQQSLDITSENLSDAESRIRDTDMAKEMMNYTKANILQQVSVSMMAQANQLPQGVLQLLQ